MASDDGSVIGSAMIGGRATDVVDLATYLPAHLSACGSGSRMVTDTVARQGILLLEPSDFLREMLSPVLKASGHRLAAVASVAEAREAVDESMAAILLDLDRDLQGTLASIAAIRERSPAVILGLTTMPTPELQRVAAEAGIDLVIGKFDRRTLLAALAEHDSGWRRAA